MPERLLQGCSPSTHRPLSPASPLLGAGLLWLFAESAAGRYGKQRRTHVVTQSCAGQAATQGKKDRAGGHGSLMWPFMAGAAPQQGAGRTGQRHCLTCQGKRGEDCCPRSVLLGGRGCACHWAHVMGDPQSLDGPHPTRDKGLGLSCESPWDADHLPRRLVKRQSGLWLDHMETWLRAQLK